MEKLLKTVISAYIECAYFCDTGEPDQCPSDTDLSDLGYIAAASDCADFLHLCERAGLLAKYRETGRTWDQFGHDFWFTRNGHGVGFWDRGMGDLGEELTKVAKSMGERYLVQGDDGMAYIE